MKYDWDGPDILWPQGQKRRLDEARAGVFVLESRRREVLLEMLKLGMLTGKALFEAEREVHHAIEQSKL